MGLSNLLRSRATHSYLTEAGLLPGLLYLLRTCPPDAMRPAVYAVGCLCANEQMAVEMMQARWRAAASA